MLLVANAGDAAIEGVIVGSIVLPLAILTLVCWFFWKAAKRGDAGERGAPAYGRALRTGRSGP